MDYEFILIFKKLGNAPKPTAEQKKQSEMTKEEWNQYFSSHWNFNGVKQTGHIAMFPEELPKRLIKMFSFAGETVFDPFLGSGTTTAAAMKLNRNSAGYEINTSYQPYIEEKLRQGTENTIEYLQDMCKIESDIFETLPYLFHDPHKIDKQVDIKKSNYGSRVDFRPKKTTEELFSVKKILSPECVLLNNGMEVRLIGVKAKAGMEREAVDFIATKTAKHKVYMRFDEKLQDKQLCYLYLDNKTFINRHLIRTGFVDVETGMDYKFKERFLDVMKHE